MAKSYLKSFLMEVLQFIWARKLWWMVPMILVFALFGTLVFLSQGSAVAPFVYVLF